jgi:nitrous-oxide reductase
VTPNTEYVVEGPQYAAPIGWGYAPLEEYETAYRGLVTFWAFDQASGRVDSAKSFQI